MASGNRKSSLCINLYKVVHLTMFLFIVLIFLFHVYFSDYISENNNFGLLKFLCNVYMRICTHLNCKVCGR